MARPRKQTVDYFPHSCTHGKTMFVLEQRYGNDGYAFWFKLLEMLGGEEGHYLQLGTAPEWEFLLAKTRIDSDKCREILDLLATLGAIDAELWTEQVVWSDNFVDGVSDAYRNRKVEIPSKPSFLRKKSTSEEIPGSIERQKTTNEIIVNEMILETTPPSPIDDFEAEGRDPQYSEPEDDATEYERMVLQTLKGVCNYPFDYTKDLRHIRSLIVDYPAINLLDEAKKWTTYKLDKPLEKKSNPRSQFRTWCGNARKFVQEQVRGAPLKTHVLDPKIESQRMELIRRSKVG